MKLFIDCEFNGWKGALISMALVPERGEPFYQVLDWSQESIKPWVRENVIPVLAYQDEGEYPISMSSFQSLLRKFLHQWDEVTIVSNWPDDIKYFCEVITPGPNSMIDMPRLNFEIRPMRVESTVPHNALADALALKAAY